MLTREDGQYIDIDGLKTFYINKGRGRPLVLIHGGAPGACTLVSWRPNINHFAEAGFAVYAPDQPGFGCTDNNPQDFSMEYRYRHAKAFIEKMGLGDFDMIANSQGAYIAARIALEDARVQRLVFTASGTISPRGSEAAQKQMRAHGEQLRSYTPSLENIRTMTMKTLFHKHLVDDDLVQLRYDMSVGKNFEAQQKRRDTPPPKPLGDQLGDLKHRTLLLWGKNDHGVAIERGVLLFQALPNAELHLFSDCGHWSQWDQTDRFHDVVRGFLNR